MSVTGFLISFSIIMMMLSLVSERASNFIKLYFQSKEISIPFLYKEDNKWKYALTVKLQILAYKQPTAMAEKEREYRVMIINVLVGILMATLANANFFEIVSQISSQKDGNTEEIAIKGILANDLNSTIIAGAIYMFFFLWSISLILFSRLYEYKTTKVGFNLSDSRKRVYTYPFLIWIFTTALIVITHTIIKEYQLKIGILSDVFGSVNFIAIIRHIFGFTITGFFLSLGSKFWHDLLDVLFKLKNTQQVLSESKTYTDYDSADSLIAFAETSQYDIVEGLYK
ncbi:hypothetical protein, partial [Flavobacterium sp.]|uniref:hypothetical protein n=1 Tax=Flavobacterium sp. TaxID=239 RepID=UPI003263559B